MWGKKKITNRMVRYGMGDRFIFYAKQKGSLSVDYCKQEKYIPSLISI